MTTERGKVILDQMASLQVYRAAINRAKATAELVGAEFVRMAGRNEGWESDDLKSAVFEMMDAADKIESIIKDYETVSACEFLGEGMKDKEGRA